MTFSGKNISQAAINSLFMMAAVQFELISVDKINRWCLISYLHDVNTQFVIIIYYNTIISVLLRLKGILMLFALKLNLQVLHKKEKNDICHILKIRTNYFHFVP